jgi:protein-disulfide isomerase
MQKRKMPTLVAIVTVAFVGLPVVFGGCSKKAVEEAKPTAPQYDTADRLGLVGAPWKGAIDGVVTIVEFSSYQCPFCGKVQPTLKQLAAEFPNDVRFVFKQHPLPNQQNAGPASEAALEAHAQGKFWEYHDILLANQRALSRADLEKYAEQVGLDLERFRKALDEGIHKDRIQKEVAAANTLGIRGTPNFMINGKNVVGAQPFDSFASVVREEMEATKKLMTEGKTLGDAFAARLETNIAARPAKASPEAPAGPVKIDVGDSVAFGPRDAKVTLVEFSDYKCGFCGRLAQALAEVKPAYTDRVLFVKKQFPLGRWPESQKAAEGALAAHAQGKHDEFSALVYENQRTFNDEMIFEFAQKIGLNMDQFRKDLETGKWADQVRKDSEAGRTAGVRGTPSLFLNGMRIGGALPADQIRAALDKALAE